MRHSNHEQDNRLAKGDDLVGDGRPAARFPGPIAEGADGDTTLVNPTPSAGDARPAMSLWDGVVRLRPTALAALVASYGGRLVSVYSPRPGGGATCSSAPEAVAGEKEPLELERFRPIELAGMRDLAPLVSPGFVKYAAAARVRGAVLLASEDLAPALAAALANDRSAAPHAPNRACPIWVHPSASWVMAQILERDALVTEVPAHVCETAIVGPHVVLAPRVVVGRNVHIGAGSVIGRAGFGWVRDDAGRWRPIPQWGGVILEDDVVIGALCTVDSGTLSPTIIRRGAKLDAHVHVGHNCDIGEDTVIAAQSGFAGSVRIGRGVFVGGQVGIADHVSVGDGARIAAKSGVIGDVAPFAAVAGYPAMPRARWLRALAWLNRASSSPVGEARVRRPVS